MQVVFEEQKITFSAVQYGKDGKGKITDKVEKTYRNEIELFGKINPEVNITLKHIFCWRRYLYHRFFIKLYKNVFT